MGSSTDRFDRWATPFLRAAFVLLVIGVMLVLGFSTQAWIIPIVAIGIYIPWHWLVMPRMDRWAERSNQRAREERLRREAEMAELDRILTASRRQPDRIAFDAETQFANGMPRYHTHYISPEKQRYLEEFWEDDPDDPDLPSLKAGVYVTPVKVTGPQRLDAVPEKPVFIPQDQVIRTTK